VESVAREMPQQPFGHLASRGVAGTQKQDSFFHFAALPMDLVSSTALSEGCRSHFHNGMAIATPATWAAMKPGTLRGRMPENVSVAARAIVTAGFANEVEEVNQYAEVI